jgi:hypothetical protein
MGMDEKGGRRTESVRWYRRGGEDSSSNEVVEKGVGRKVSGEGGAKGSGVMNE